MGPSPVFMPVISQPSQFTATAACDDELLLQAWEAANLKARELGWIN
jgi:hypothetical protein